MDSLKLRMSLGKNGMGDFHIETQDLSSGQANLLINGMIDNCIDQIENSLDNRETKEADSIGEQL